MSRTQPDTTLRRLRLRVALKLMLAIGLLGTAYVVISAIGTQESGRPTVPTMRVTIADLMPGSARLLTWEGRPVIVYRRQDREITLLSNADARLRDPASQRSEQPEGLTDEYRSATPSLFVAIALGTDLGCSVSYLPASAELFQGSSWQGGFVDSCRRSRYDLAGRVYGSQYAERNLIVPDYTVSGDSLLLGG